MIPDREGRGHAIATYPDADCTEWFIRASIIIISKLLHHYGCAQSRLACNCSPRPLQARAAVFVWSVLADNDGDYHAVSARGPAGPRRLETSAHLRRNRGGFQIPCDWPRRRAQLQMRRRRHRTCSTPTTQAATDSGRQRMWVSTSQGVLAVTMQEHLLKFLSNRIQSGPSTSSPYLNITARVAVSKALKMNYAHSQSRKSTAPRVPVCAGTQAQGRDSY